MSELHDAVRAEIDAHVAAHPPFATLYARRRSRRLRRAVAGLSVAATVAGVLALLPFGRPEREAEVPLDPAPPLVACERSRLGFPPSALDAPLGAENGTDGAAATLRALVRSDPNDFGFPRTGWRELLREPDRVLFADAKLRWSVVVEREGTRWDAAGYGECGDLTVPPPPGMNAATWSPAGPVGPDAESFVASVDERACSSGRGPAGRIEPPRIVYLEDTVVVTFVVRAGPGNARTCQGAPAAEYEVRLREPLGDRRLQDGYYYPPTNRS